jgi:predicted P-loop ATPase/GTPase
MNKQTKIIRLKDGEDIMTSFIETSDNMLILENPMSVFFKRLSVNKSMVMMSPWLPIELIKENNVEIHKHDVLTLIEPKESLIEYYNNAVEEANEVMQQSERIIDEALLDETSDEELEEVLLDEMDEEIKERFQSKEPGTKKKLIH